MLKIYIALVVAMLVFTANFALAEPPSVQCTFIAAKSAPVIDGKLNDAVWKSISPSAKFKDNSGKYEVKYGATFKSATDGKYLYIAIELSDPNPSKLPTKNLGKDKLDWSEDVELFLAPYADQPDYYHFGVDPAGTDADCKGLGNPIDFGCSWRHKESINAKGWITEIALPITELGRAQGLKNGDILSLNICRSTKGSVPLQCWSPTFGGFNNRDAFGTLVVGGFKSAASNKIKTISSHLADLKKYRSQAVKNRIVQLSSEIQGLSKRAASIKTNADWNSFVADCAKLDNKINLAALADKNLMVWSVNPWSLPWSETLPTPNTRTVDTIRIDAFQGEYVTRAVAITNATDDTASFRCIPTDLVTQKWTKRALAADHISLFEAQEVALRGGGRQRDPLPELRIENVVNLSPGKNSVLWMTINTNGLEPGQWFATVVVKPTVRIELQKKIKIIVNVLPAQFPNGPEPYSVNWASYNRPTADRYPEACHEDQKQHLTNVHVVDWADMALASVKIGADGKPANDPDFTGLDKLISVFGNKDQVYVLTSVYEWIPREFGGGGSWTQKEQDNFTWFVRKMRSHMEEKGISVRNFAWYPKDEPVSDTDAGYVANFGKLLQAADPEQQIFTTVFNAVKLSALEIMAPYVNLWVPSMWLGDEQIGIIKSQKARLFSYSVLGRDSGPYLSYRLDAWRALDRGYEGIGFWDYNDCGGSVGASVWDDNDGDRSDYSVIYEGTNKPVSSARWEAWRQGIQDYRLIKWYASLTGASIADASTLPGEAVKAVLKSGDAATAGSYYDKIRKDTLKTLVSTGKISESSLSSSRKLVCLTGNGGDNVENLDTGGTYTYSTFPDSSEYIENCGVKEGQVFFRGKNAKEGPQGQNHRDGLITDGLLSYPFNYALCIYPPQVWSVIFDMKKSYRLSHLLTYVDSKGVAVSISNDGKEGSWAKIDEIADRENGPKSYDNAAFLDLKDSSARYIKLDMATEGQTVRLGECRIFGWK